MAIVCNYPDKDELVDVGPVGSTDDVSNDDYRYLDVGLPPEIARLKAAGHLDEAIAECTRVIESGVQPELEACLRVERHRMGRLARQFSVTRDRALELIRAEWPPFTEDDLDRLVRTRRMDWRFIDGEQRFLKNLLDSLRVYPAEVPGLKPEPPADIAARDAMLARMRADGQAERAITLRARIEVPGALPGETVRAWLPLPAASFQQSDIQVLDATPGAQIAPEDVPARTVYWESTDRRAFEVTYRYRICAPYVDTLAPAPAQHAVADPDPAYTSADLAEQRPHIRFTPYLQALTARVVADIERPIDRARAIYDYITRNVDYRYQPAYAQLDDIADSCAKSLRGDCGVFALTFITMCRIAGIPARWQSGLYVAPDHVGPHDWAQFYTDEYGWLWADCSFGSSARRTGDEARRLHHFGNLDPWRMVANGAFQAELTPPADGIRWDPFDNQTGEASVDGRGCDDCEMARSVELISLEEA
ncbi:transglutaminase-like domain-containing protein [Collinsella sp. An2]|uniref:transglutaminase-like domain-containing protein n=1 Tax=Collinsella sp. An2 TaxID=1965585 RepID=UPI000B398058|nr:transglutaminase-like domain-containing protein [Collinsella sp. An2]OUP07678.1 transglutaminase [Collinsella sp. An2]